MLARSLSRLLILTSVMTLAAASYYFLSRYRALGQRERIIASLKAVVEEEGPCAGLAAARDMKGPTDPEIVSTINALRGSFVNEVVGLDDKLGKRALLSADSEGRIDRDLCERIRLSTSLGETNPVLELLRYTRTDESPCDQEASLDAALSGLGSHRSEMLHALMRDVHKLECLSPPLAERIAGMVVETVYTSPRAMDDLDVLRVAHYLDDWVPLGSAQFGCRVEARGEVSLLGSVVGCTPDMKRRILSHYTTLLDLAATPRTPVLPHGSEVLLLREDDKGCEVMPAAGEVVAYTLPCSELSLHSDLHVAVRIDSVSYGRAAADLIAGLATYVGQKGSVVSSTVEPDLRSWYGYDRAGAPLGSAGVVELTALASLIGENVPERPLQAFCKQSGAKYCYDVDWAHAVSRLEGEPVLFLSRPAHVFLEEAPLSAGDGLALFSQAFGRQPTEGAFWRIYRFGTEALFVVESERDNVELRWREGPTVAWQSQKLGRSEGGAAAPSARLLAALDLSRDGRPEIVIQRVQREAAAEGPRDVSDVVELLHLDAGGDHFITLNSLTVREY